MKIDFSANIQLKCTQCGNKQVMMSRIFGLYCMACGWYRNNQSGMLRGKRG